MASDNIGEVKLKLTLDTAEFDKSQKKVESSVKSTYSVMNQVMGDLTARAIASATAEVKKLAREVVEVGASFDAAMSKVSAVSGATGSDLESLRTKAREMGRVTVFSATESAEAFNYMAMAGWGTGEMLDGIEGVMNLAAASGTDLATTSDIVTDALTAMGYSAKDAGKFADVMAAASANANTNVEMMGETFKYAASVAGSLGYNIEDTAVAIGLMANAGIKSTQAGTSLRSIMSKLAAPTEDVQEAMRELGVSLVDDSGNMRSLDSVMKDLRKGFSRLSVTQKAEKAETIAGRNAMSGLLAIVNASEADYKKLTAAVNDSSGAAKRMADEMNNNVAGKFKLLKSQLEDVALTIWDKLSPTITKALDKVSEALKRVDWDMVAKAIGDALNVVTDGFIWIINNGDIVAKVIGAIVAAFVVVKIAEFGSALGELISIVGTLGSALTAFVMTPVGAAITAIGLLAAGVAAATGAFNDNNKAASELAERMREQRKVIDDTKDSWGALQDAREKSLDKGLSEMNYYHDLTKELQNITDENGKVRDGYEKRASFIVTTLADALGSEIFLQDGVVKGYEKIQDSIDQTIVKKKAEIILNAQEAAYTEAITKRSEALRRQTELRKELSKVTEEADWAEAEYWAALEKHDTWAAETALEKWNRLAKDREEVKYNYETQKQLVADYASTIAEYEENMALFHAGEYEKMTSTGWQYVSNLSDENDAKLELLQRNIQDEKAWVEALRGLRNEANSEAIASQIEASEKKIAALEDEMTQYKQVTSDGLAETKIIWSDDLDSILSEVTGSNIEFVDAGNGNVDAYLNGIKQKEQMPIDTVADMVTEMVKRVVSQEPNAEESAKQIINGINEGVKNGSVQAEVFKSIDRFSSGILNVFNDFFVIRSPSRVMAKSGTNIVYGVGNGISNSGAQSSVFASVRNFANKVVSQFRAAFDIHSPSRLMRDVVGKNIAAGIGVGFEDEISNVEKDMRTEVRNLADDIYAAVPTFDYSVASTANAIIDAPDANQALISDGNYTEHEQPLVVNLVLDGKQIQQVILQDIRRSI